MKTNSLRTWTNVCAAVLTAAVLRVSADQSATDVTKDKQDKTYTGTVVSIDAKERVLTVKSWSLLKKEFNLGDNCTYTFVNRGEGSLADLRPGERVRVAYQNAKGVLVAKHVRQEPLRYEGVVTAIDPQTRTLIVDAPRAGHKSFGIPEECRVVLRDDKSGSLASIKPGHHVTVLYETPNEQLCALQIAQTSAEFVGTLSAIDLNERTIKAKGAMGTRKFNVADGCTILNNGKIVEMRDLKPGDRLAFSYDAVDGVNIANRVASAPAPATESVARYPYPN